MFASEVRRGTLLLTLVMGLGCGSAPPPVPSKRQAGAQVSCSSRDGAKDCFCGQCGGACWRTATTCGCECGSAQAQRSR